MYLVAINIDKAIIINNPDAIKVIQSFINVIRPGKFQENSKLSTKQVFTEIITGGIDYTVILENFDSYSE